MEKEKIAVIFMFIEDAAIFLYAELDVMIVDDEYIVREDLRMLIKWEEQGFRIIAEAENGQRGIEMFEKFHPQLILTDIKMPVMSGLDMVNIIMEKAPQTQFILLTAYGEFDYARRAMEKGISAYLLKMHQNQKKNCSGQGAAEII